MLIDAAHPEEIRVAVVTNNTLEDFDSETITKRQLKGNIYLAKVVRVEPALQAAFVDFGGERHGFLPFAEIHPDYYRIPVGDRPEEDNTQNIVQESENESKNDLDKSMDESSDLIKAKLEKKQRYRYKIQEVIKRKQLMLIQVVKEERGGKGAALTTYVSIPGRYSVLMPNAGNRGGGVSKKIYDGEDRKRLRQILKDLNVPEGMSLIVRTAGHERTKIEIKRDYEYLFKLWEEIRNKTITSNAPDLIYAEGDLVKRAIRDIYTKDIEEILVEGDEAYKEAKSFMRSLMPSHTKKVQHYKDAQVPLFYQYKVDEHIDRIMLPKVNLPSGGYLVINITEALVAIDVNSGRAIKERNIDSTALKTNLEAAQEAARQIRLRDLAGIIVVDFIDMEEHTHINQVERRFKEALKVDRARVQVGRISQFGLMELSRQRLRPSLFETHTTTCIHCNGVGVIRSVESMALHVLRAIEKEAFNGHGKEITVSVSDGVDLYLLNQKRHIIVGLEQSCAVKININRDSSLPHNDYRIEALVQKVVSKKTTETNEQNKAKQVDSKKVILNKESVEISEESELPKNILRQQVVPKDETQQTEDSLNTKLPLEKDGVDRKQQKRTHRYKRYHKKPRDGQSQAPAVNTPIVIPATSPQEKIQLETVENKVENLDHKKHKRYHRKPRFNNQAKSQSGSTPQEKVQLEIVDNKKVEQTKKPNYLQKTHSIKPKDTIDLPVQSNEIPANKTVKNNKKNWIQRLLD